MQSDEREVGMAVLTMLRQGSYAGWLVVEQDMVTQSSQDAANAEAAQVRNRTWLREHAGF